MIDTVGTQGISSDEEVQIPGETGKRFAVFDKPWRSQALVNLYRYLDMIHAATRNPNGNPIRARYHTHRVRQGLIVPKRLPADCYNHRYLNNLEPLDRHLIRPGPNCGVEDLYMKVRMSGL